MELFRQFKNVLVLVLSALFLYVGLVNLLDRMEWKSPWDGIRWSQTSEGVEVESAQVQAGDKD